MDSNIAFAGSNLWLGDGDSARHSYPMANREQATERGESRFVRPPDLVWYDGQNSSKDPNCRSRDISVFE